MSAPQVGRPPFIPGQRVKEGPWGSGRTGTALKCQWVEASDRAYLPARWVVVWRPSTGGFLVAERHQLELVPAARDRRRVAAIWAGLVFTVGLALFLIAGGFASADAGHWWPDVVGQFVASYFACGAMIWLWRARRRWSWR